MLRAISSSFEASALCLKPSRSPFSTSSTCAARPGANPRRNSKLSNSARFRLETPQKVASPKRFGARGAPPASSSSASPKNPRFAARPSRFVSAVEEAPGKGKPQKKEWKIGRSVGPHQTARDAFLRRNPPHQHANKATLPDVGALAAAIASSPSAQPAPILVAKRVDGFVGHTPLKVVDVPFQTPPLLPGLLACLHGAIGKGAKPFPIQSLSMSHFLGSTNAPTPQFPPTSSRTLLASETGSGKSIAYLIPLIQGLKTTESASDPSHPDIEQSTSRPIRHSSTPIAKPRAIILAPTHELCRQLSAYAKSLSHDVKLRTVCLSNKPPRISGASSRDAEAMWNAGVNEQSELSGPRPVDIFVGTPSKIAQMAALEVETSEESPWAASREKPATLKHPEISFENVEWVVIDEADVLFDRDFRQLVHGILDAVKLARGDTEGSAPAEAALEVELDPSLIPESIPPAFNLILTTATIPSALNTHLLMNFPNLIRLTSPKLHRLPSKLSTERVDIKGMGNPNAAMHKKLLDIFADQGRRATLSTTSAKGSSDGRVILFCNQAKKAEEIGAYLNTLKMPTLVMTGSSKERRRGSNNHLESFLAPPTGRRSADARAAPNHRSEKNVRSEPAPRVLVTTSLLARGLDFSPSVSHVLIVDEPRNEVDFLHRAGRTGRAGRSGTVVVFGKGIAPRKAKKPGFA